MNIHAGSTIGEQDRRECRVTSKLLLFFGFSWMQFPLNEWVIWLKTHTHDNNIKRNKNQTDVPLIWLGLLLSNYYIDVTAPPRCTKISISSIGASFNWMSWHFMPNEFSCNAQWLIWMKCRIMNMKRKSSSNVSVKERQVTVFMTEMFIIQRYIFIGYNVRCFLFSWFRLESKRRKKNRAH